MLQHVLAHFPFKINKIFIDDGVQFTYKLLSKHIQAKDSKLHPFDQICQEHDREHRHTSFKHPWTNGLVARMNPSIKKATVQTCFSENLDELKTQLMRWLVMYHHQTKLKSLGVKTPYDTLIEEDECNPTFFLVFLSMNERD